MDDQRTAIERHASLHDLTMDAWYVDDALSGTGSRKRGAFRQMISDAQSRPRPFDCVIAYDVKRFGRMDNDETGYYRHLLRMSGVDVIYVTEGFTGRFEDDLVRPVKQWQARQESKDLAKVTIRGYLSKFHGGKGWWMAGVPPYGYDRRYEDADGKFLFIVRNMPDMTKQMLTANGRIIRRLKPKERLILSDRDHCRLIPSLAERVVVVQRIFHDCIHEGLGCTMIANRLNHEGISTPFETHWTRIGTAGLWKYATIRNILLNPAHTGDVVWNRRTAAKFYRIQRQGMVERLSRDVQSVRFNAQEDWLIARDAHEPLVSRRAFEQARTLLTSRNAARRRFSPDYHRTESDFRAQFVLTGLLQCAHCQGSFWGKTLSRTYSARRPRPYRAKVYSCRHNHHANGTPCRRESVRQRILERLVCERLDRWYGGFLTRDGRSIIRAASREHCRRLADGYATSEGRAALAADARLFERGALSFLGELRQQLCSVNSPRRRLAFRRCIDHIRIDCEARRITLYVKRFPLLGSVPGGCARVLVRLPEGIAMGPKKKQSRAKEFDLEWHLARKPAPTRKLCVQAIKSILASGPRIRQSFLHEYIAFSLGRHFACLRVQRTRILVNLKLKPSEIEEWPPFMRDVTGHWIPATGNVEVSIRSTGDVRAAIPYIRLAYQRVAAASPV